MLKNTRINNFPEYIWNNKNNFGIQNKEIYAVKMALPFQVYSSETWTPRRTNERRLEAAALMWLLRCVAGCTLQNEVITGNEEAGQINTLEEEELARTPCFQETLKLSTNKKT